MTFETWNEWPEPWEARFEREGYVDIVVTRGGFMQEDNVWANSPEGLSSMSSGILSVMGPKPHEIKAVVVMNKGEGKHQRYRVFFERDPCPVIFFGGDTCPTCGGTHE